MREEFQNCCRNDKFSSSLAHILGALDSRYTLGARIIVLNYYIRTADPVLQLGLPLLEEVVENIGLDCVVSALHGHYVSSDELEADLSALAVPLPGCDGSVFGAVSVVSIVARVAVIDFPKLAQMVIRAAGEISARIALKKINAGIVAQSLAQGRSAAKACWWRRIQYSEGSIFCGAAWRALLANY